MKAMESMKCIKRGVSVLMGIGLAMLLSVLLWGSGGSVSAQDATDPVLVGAGDIATPPGDDDADSETAQLVLDILGEEDPDNVNVFTAGDNAYGSGTEEEFENAYDPTWGQFEDHTKPVPGNHDYKTPGAEGYFEYFGEAAEDPSDEDPSDEDPSDEDPPYEGYYSYDLGDWHIVALNSNCDEGEVPGGCEPASPMVTWLEQDLAANPRTCTLAYFHHPLFTSGEKHRPGDENVRPLWEALYAANADVVLNGHDHNYQHFAPQDPEGGADPERGIRQFVVGTGGRDLYNIEDPLDNTKAHDDKTHGVLKLTLHPSSYDWQFVPVAGQDFTDSGTGICHDGPVPTSTATATTTATITALPKNGGPELMLPVTLVASLALIASGVGALVLLRRSL